MWGVGLVGNGPESIDNMSLYSQCSYFNVCEPSSVAYSVAKSEETVSKSGGWAEPTARIVFSLVLAYHGM